LWSAKYLKVIKLRSCSAIMAIGSAILCLRILASPGYFALGVIDVGVLCPTSQKGIFQKTARWNSQRDDPNW
jgi:hypothetical protein